MPPDQTDPEATAPATIVPSVGDLFNGRTIVGVDHVMVDDSYLVQVAAGGDWLPVAAGELVPVS